MVDMTKIKDLSSRIAREFNPRRIILFGSHAYGHPDRDSDVDLLIILQFKGKAVRKAIEIRNRINPQIPVDIIVRTPEQVAKRIAENDFFLREVVEKGQTLYEASHE